MRFGRLKKAFSLTDIAIILKDLGIPYEIQGKEIYIDKLCSIKAKEDKGLYYLEDEGLLQSTDIKNSIIICNKLPQDLGQSNSFVLVNDPQAVYYKLCRFFFEYEKKCGIHHTAVIDNEADIDSEVYIGPYSVIGKCSIKKGANIHAHVVIYDNTTIGKDVTIEAGSYIGATGVAWVWGQNGDRIIQPQVGGVVVNDECFIGTNVTVVRGSLNECTEIGHHTVISHGTKIGHGVKIGPYSHLANNVTLAGGVQINEMCFLGAGSVVSSNVTLAKGVIVGAGAVVVRNISEENVIVAGVPATVIKRVGVKHKGVPKNIK